MGKPDISADYRIVSDGDATQDRGIGINRYIVFDNGMSGNIHRQSFFVEGEILGAERYALVKADVIADDGCLAHNNASPVVDTEIFADLRAGMDVDARAGMRHFRNDAWEDRYAKLEECMSRPLVEHGVYGGITEDDFTDTFGRRVAIEDGFDIGRKQVFDMRKLVYEFHGDALGILFCLPIIILKNHTPKYLFVEQIVELFQINPRIITDRIRLRLLFRAKEAREKDLSQEFHDIPDLWHRRRRCRMEGNIGIRFGDVGRKYLYIPPYLFNSVYSSHDIVLSQVGS